MLQLLSFAGQLKLEFSFSDLHCIRLHDNAFQSSEETQSESFTPKKTCLRVVGSDYRSVDFLSRSDFFDSFSVQISAIV